MLPHVTLASGFSPVWVFNQWHVENRGQVIGCREGIGEVGRGFGRLISGRMSYRPKGDRLKAIFINAVIKYFLY